MIGALSQLYASALLATVPLAIAWVAALLFARSPAATRLLIWRAAVASLLVIFVAQLTPFRWAAGVVPTGLAEPLVTLGRMQVDASSDPVSHRVALLALGAWLLGAMLVLIPLIVGWVSASRIAERSSVVRAASWRESFNSALQTLGVSREVTLVVSAEQAVPVTAGILRPRIIIPASSLGWPESQRRALLLHELSHVQSGDIAWSVAGRVARALFWFHPLAWLATSELHATCELARDDRVLASGVKQSEYAELLLAAAASLDPRRTAATLALAGGPLRERLHAVLTPDRDLSAAGPARVIAVAALTLAISLPLGALRPTPTRDVLTTLMRDSRWDSRAYAVTRLAQRADTVAIARRAAEFDPSPRVRAIATHALSSSAVAEDREPRAESRGPRFE